MSQTPPVRSKVQQLAKLIDVASHAPTGHNTQPVEWLVIQDKETCRELAGHVIDWMRYMVKNQPDIAQRLNMSVLVDLWDRGQDRICRDAPQLVAAYASKEFGAAPADCHNALAYLELILPPKLLHKRS